MSDAESARRFRRGALVRWSAAALFACAVALWVMSYWCVPGVSTGNWDGGPRVVVGAARGSLVMTGWWKYTPACSPGAGIDTLGHTVFDELGPWWWFGHAKSWVIGSVWWAPMWAVVGPLGVLVWWAWRRGRAPGRCAKCGYDLRGLVSAACPECGATLSA